MQRSSLLQLILLLEGNRAMRALLTNLLAQNTRSRVAYASTDVAMFKFIQHIKPELIIVDVHNNASYITLPDRLHQLSGYEAIPVLVLSAPAARDELDSQKVIYLADPLDFHVFLAAIRRMLPYI